MAQPPQEWIDALSRADADVAAGRLADSAEIHRELRVVLDRMLATLDRVEARAALVAQIIEGRRGGRKEEE